MHYVMLNICNLLPCSMYSGSDWLLCLVAIVTNVWLDVVLQVHRWLIGCFVTGMQVIDWMFCYRYAGDWLDVVLQVCRWLIGCCVAGMQVIDWMLCCRYAGKWVDVVLQVCRWMIGCCVAGTQVVDWMLCCRYTGDWLDVILQICRWADIWCRGRPTWGRHILVWPW